MGQVFAITKRVSRPNLGAAAWLTAGRDSKLGATPTQGVVVDAIDDNLGQCTRSQFRLFDPIDGYVSPLLPLCGSRSLVSRHGMPDGPILAWAGRHSPRTHRTNSRFEHCSAMHRRRNLASCLVLRVIANIDRHSVFDFLASIIVYGLVTSLSQLSVQRFGLAALTASAFTWAWLTDLTPPACARGPSHV